MARVPKTGYMMVIDVGRSTARSCGDQSFFEKAKECGIRIMGRNICSFPQDEIGLVLMGTDETSNQLNTDHGSGYEHICEASEVKLPNWHTSRILENKVLRSNSEANWFDALIVAADFLRAGTENRSFKQLHIFLISALEMSADVSQSEIRSLLESLEVMVCRVHIISDQIEHSKPITSSTIFTPRSSGAFVDEGVKSEDRIKNEKLLDEILQTEGFTLTSIDAAHRCLGFYVPKPVRPTPWNSTLTIGTKLKFAISAYLLISEQKGLGPFKVTSAGGSAANSVVTMRTQHFQNEKPIDLDMEDVIVGYMYGSSVVPYDNAIDMDYKSGEAGLNCLGFTASSNILDEYLSGKGTYLVMAKKGCAGSEEKLTALVKAMMALNVVMLASKIYRKDTKPRLQTLLPIMHEQRYPCLVMLELVFQDEINLVRFPSILTSKHQPSPEQYAAVDKLIDSMNLTDAVEDEHGRSHEAFGLKETHNPNHQFLYRSVVHRATHPNATSLPVLGSDVSELVSVPRKLIQRAQAAIDEIKQVFPLEEQKRITRTEWLQRMAAMHQGSGDAAPSGTAPSSSIATIDDESERRVVLTVGTMTPAEDFDLLLRRGEKFVTVATQMQTVIFELLFTAMHTPVEKIIMALMMYRGEAQKLGPFRYNEWLTEFKQVLLQRRKHEFWEEVIVREKLGLIDVSESDMSTVSVDDAIEFYRIPAVPTSGAETIVKDDVDLDSLFEELNG
ncbi:X-ray repair cross-complementing protein 5-like [Anopheles aquasalis]|uniref:X-ray repair cross-complementing protein 5-like n=1 Tax=Anopheles aquasalis TaxID=42839 RepID=UPI00215A2AAC|nr:X-ray repair cross-complementing protein 5-like [Anopheles aquasalis]